MATTPRKNHVPKLCLQKPDLAYVKLNGQKHYLGQFGSAEAREGYARLLQEWEANGRKPIIPRSASDKISVAEIGEQFRVFAESHYRKPDGTPTSEVDNIRQAWRVVRQLYGTMAAEEFGPKKLLLVRQDMIKRGWSRSHINKQIGRVKLVFRWAAKHELISPSVWHGLSAVEGLKRGRSDARETEPVRPVPDAYIDAIRPFVSRQVEALIDLQLLTGARPCELLALRATDLDTSGPIWTAALEHHKTAHHGNRRVLLFGPKAQSILGKFIVDRPVGAYLFSAAEGRDERLAQRHEKRETPLDHGNGPGTNRVRNPKVRPGGCYTVGSYRRAIQRACDRAFPLPPGEAFQPRLIQRGKAKKPRLETARQVWQRLTDEQRNELRCWRQEHRWHPYQLRHNAASNLRRMYGIEMSQTVLGHRVGSKITEIYAEANLDSAKEVLLKIG